MIVPLRKQNADGIAYFRPPAIEDSLAVLCKLPIEEVARRASINDPENAEYVPSECMLYFVRQSKLHGDGDAYRDLFVILRRRILQAVPINLRRIPDLANRAVKASDSDIQDFVLHAFQEMLCADRTEYDERLDFYEVKFNAAVAALRTTAKRKVVRYESRREPLACESGTLTLSSEMEQVLARVKNSDGHKENDFLYRSKLHAAINTLRTDERRVIELILQDVPIDSKDEKVLTIVKILGCAEKTVRNRRDRAFAKIRESLKEEEVT